MKSLGNLGFILVFEKEIPILNTRFPRCIIYRSKDYTCSHQAQIKNRNVIIMFEALNFASRGVSLAALCFETNATIPPRFFFYKAVNSRVVLKYT